MAYEKAAQVLGEVVQDILDGVQDIVDGITPDPPVPPVPPPIGFQRIDQYLGQVLDFNSMTELSAAGWKWGWQTFTLQSGNLHAWLDQVSATGRKARISANKNWFIPSNSGMIPSPLGMQGVDNIETHAAIINGIEIEAFGSDSKTEEAYNSLGTVLASRGLEHLLSGYMHAGRDRDGYSRIWYPLAGYDTPKHGELKVRAHDFGVYPLSRMHAHGPQRTPENMPVAGTKTGNMWCQVSGRRVVESAFAYEAPATPTAEPVFEYSGSNDQIWGPSDGGSGASNETLTGFIRPGRVHLDYQLQSAHRIGCNSVSWYTNGSSMHPGQSMSQYAPELLGDLIHVIEAYEAQEVINTWEPSYKARNPLVTVAPPNS